MSQAGSSELNQCVQVRGAYSAALTRLLGLKQEYSMSSVVLGIYDHAGPVLIRASAGMEKPNSQSMAVLGSLMTYADGQGLSFGSIATTDHRIGFFRYKVGVQSA